MKIDCFYHFYVFYNIIKQNIRIPKKYSMAKNNLASDMLFKVIIVGDSGVGKTNLLTYFCEGVFK